MSTKIPKVVDTLYAVLVNDTVVDQEFKTLAKARKYVKNMQMTENVKKVEVVKQCTTHTLLNTYTPKIQRVLTISDLDFSGDGET